MQELTPTHKFALAAAGLLALLVFAALASRSGSGLTGGYLIGATQQTYGFPTIPPGNTRSKEPVEGGGTLKAGPTRYFMRAYSPNISAQVAPRGAGFTWEFPERRFNYTESFWLRFPEHDWEDAELPPEMGRGYYVIEWDNDALPELQEAVYELTPFTKLPRGGTKSGPMPRDSAFDLIVVCEGETNWPEKTFRGELIADRMVPLLRVVEFKGVVTVKLPE